MQPYQQPGYPQQLPPQKSNLGLILGIVGGVVVLVGIGVAVLAILAVSGTRKYVNNAKQAEAKNSLGQIAKDAAAAYENEELDPLEPAAKTTRHLCASASAPIPASQGSISGKKYQSAPSEWQVDADKKAGFACLKFEMYAPQYYQYDYKSTGDAFTGIARGDLNGDGKFSDFEIKGQVQNGHVIVAPSILERDPEE